MTLQFRCSIMCELPFMLNLPSGTYSVMGGGASIDLDLLQEQIAVYFDQERFAIGDPTSLRQQLGSQYEQLHKQQLRTILRQRLSRTVEESDLPPVSDQDILDDMQTAILRQSPPGTFHQKNQELQDEAKCRVEALSVQERAAFALASAKWRLGRQMPRSDEFLEGVNALIRLYMERFNDFFVEEVAIHQLASQAPLRGVFVDVSCDGEALDHYGIVLRFPPMMRRPWLNHPAEKVQVFASDLAAGVLPDSTNLLGVRARAFLQRGAYRSAIIEASAALDHALSRKIREGYQKAGKLVLEIEAILKKPSNQRFDERAKTLLKEATGQSAAAFDNTLWSNVVDHRSKLRQGVTHSDADPPKKEAEQVVGDFLRLAELIGGIAV